MSRQRSNSNISNFNNKGERPRREYAVERVSYKRFSDEERNDRFRNNGDRSRNTYNQVNFRGRGRGRVNNAYGYTSLNRYWGCGKT